uniref:Uncharacterized protein n=1 Tax=Odontella aurita TaxID=265563 RepID=A0A7S4JMY5_9STRA|mmetsp:Transcript_49897/g.150021  ORF Transcript_49897/g.150021 Transcript_49897/m.150021 type:complete len:852 (+) Transcript_49897:987-3542(+)
MSNFGNTGGGDAAFRQQTREPRNNDNGSHGSWRKRRPQGEGVGGRGYQSGYARRCANDSDGRRFASTEVDNRWKGNDRHGPGNQHHDLYHQSYQQEGRGNACTAGPTCNTDGGQRERLLDYNRNDPIPKKKGRYGSNSAFDFGQHERDNGRKPTPSCEGDQLTAAAHGEGFGFSGRNNWQRHKTWNDRKNLISSGEDRCSDRPPHRQAWATNSNSWQGSNLNIARGEEKISLQQTTRPMSSSSGANTAVVKKVDVDTSAGLMCINNNRDKQDEKAACARIKQVKDDFEEFQSMTWREKILSQFRYEPAIDLPEEAFNEDSQAWAARKSESAERAITAVVDRMHGEAKAEIECEDQSDSDYDDPIFGGGDRPEDRYMYSRSQVEKFFRAAPWCLLMTIGFDVTGIQSSHEENCHCPCGADMVRWRTQFGLEGSVAGKDVKREFCTKGKMTPVGLMGHLRTEGDKNGGLLHFGLRIYMEHLYGKDDGSYRAGIGHKAMYFINDSNWRRAEAAANRAKVKELKKVEQLLAEEKLRTQQLEEERKKDQEKIKFINHVNKDLGRQIQQLKDDKAALHIESRKETTIVSEETLTMARKHMEAFFAMGKVASKWGCATDEETNLEIEVNQNFILQEFLDKTYRRHLKLIAMDRCLLDATLLFSDLKGTKVCKNYYGNKLLSDWNVVFLNEFKYGRKMSGREQKKLDTAIDEGGPTREFISQFFYQIGDVCIDGDTIFEQANNGIYPRTDEWLNYRFGHSSELMNKVQAYYIFFGRVVLHALATGHTIASSAIPPPYRNCECATFLACNFTAAVCTDAFCNFEYFLRIQGFFDTAVLKMMIITMKMFSFICMKEIHRSK